MSIVSLYYELSFFQCSMVSSHHGKVLGAFGTSLIKPLHEGRQAFITEQQIKRYALEGFDQPGYCFYVSYLFIYSMYILLCIDTGRWRSVCNWT